MFINLKSIAKWGFDYQQKLNEFLSTTKADENEKEIQIPWAVFMERRIGKKVIPATLEETMIASCTFTAHIIVHRSIRD